MRILMLNVYTKRIMIEKKLDLNLLKSISFLFPFIALFILFGKLTLDKIKGFVNLMNKTLIYFGLFPEETLPDVFCRVSDSTFPNVFFYFF